jgi:DNA replication protein DnaC
MGVGVDKLCQILSKREKKWTVVTANLSLAEIAKQMDSRISSRLLRNNSYVVEVNAEDYEIRRRKS